VTAVAPIPRPRIAPEGATYTFVGTHKDGFNDGGDGFPELQTGLEGPHGV
jgi:hypothetical protein